MTSDDIIHIARKYGCVIAEDGPDCQFEVSFHADQIIAMVRAAQAAEREACARVTARISGRPMLSPPCGSGWEKPNEQV